MPATVTADVAPLIYAKVIEMLICAYQYDDANFIRTVRYKDISKEKTSTQSFPREVKTATYAPVATELTALSTVALGFTTVDVAVSRFGVARSITNTIMEDTILDNALYTQKLAQDAGLIFGELLDSSVAAQFANVTGTVGVTNTPLTVATLVSGFAQQRINKSKGRQVVALHDSHLGQLQSNQSSTTATAWSQFFLPNGDNTQYGGVFMGADVWASGLNPSANAGVDRVGCIYAEGSNAFSSFAYVSKRMPSSLTQTDILSDANLWASFTRLAVATIAPNFGTKIIARATP